MGKHGDDVVAALPTVSRGHAMTTGRPPCPPLDAGGDWWSIDDRPSRRAETQPQATGVPLRRSNHPVRAGDTGATPIRPGTQPFRAR